MANPKPMPQTHKRSRLPLALLIFISGALPGYAGERELPHSATARQLGFGEIAGAVWMRARFLDVGTLRSCHKHDFVVAYLGNGQGLVFGGKPPRVRTTFTCRGNVAATVEIGLSTQIYYYDFYGKLVTHGPVRGAAKTSIRKHSGQSEAFAVSPNELLLADVFVTSDKVVRLFDMKTLKQRDRVRIERWDGFIDSLTFSAGGGLLGVVETEGKMTVIPVSKKGKFGKPLAVADGVKAIAPIAGTNDFLVIKKTSVGRLLANRQLIELFKTPPNSRVAAATTVVRKKKVFIFAVADNGERTLLVRTQKGKPAAIRKTGSGFGDGIERIAATKNYLCSPAAPGPTTAATANCSSSSSRSINCCQRRNDKTAERIS